MVFDKIQRNDFDRVSNLLSRIGDEYIPPLDEQIEDMGAYVEKIVTYSDIFVAVDGEVDVGILSIYCNGGRTQKAFITTIGVDSRYKKKGIAEELLLLAINHIKKKGFLVIGLEVNKNNLRAIGFYKKNGFLINKELNDSYFMGLKLVD